MKPTADQLKAALEVARKMRGQGDDPDSLAQSVLYLYQRDAMLERILLHLERFLQFGLPEEEHAKLVRLIEEAKAQERAEKGGYSDDFGL
ncbi:hypothetical protein [Sedimenticola selenatireducens]|uniref:Uncharacterized protein n=1 Tax=Sedimenticola selenatireducens TaxID=191960 RepID=A0A558DN28_9GAMM|nr:hypothetical protein [Sedimenticola selenatireducens]TVO74845.1 hypothetical protein FHP88_10135 [Sedimenticola selenatireducens]TVT62380.1 MAG: hypothetical protein FHK78_14700 [Sedimenticola selenatireducens]